MRTWMVILLGVACNGDDDTGDDNGQDTDTQPSETVSVDIVAADGGTVEVAEATLTIPPGALAEDTTITAMTVDAAGLPDAATIVGDGIDFGPDGLTFLLPVTLTIEAGAAPASGKTYVLSWLDGAAWVDLATTITGTAGSAPVEHFTGFAMRSVDLPANVDVCEFTACQGDVVGNWNLLGLCFSDEFPNPYAALCPTSTYELTFDSSGTYNVMDGGTYDYAVSTSVTTTATFPAECNLEFTDCAAWNNITLTQCTGDVAVECVCELTSPAQPTAGFGTWGYQGDQVWFDDGEGQSLHDYCRENTILKVREVESGVITTVGL